MTKPVLRAFGSAVVRELWGPAATISLTVLVLGRLVQTPWLHYLLYDGDSLALPLLLKSLRSGEPLEWVMTSQLFLFPEIPLYLLSALVSTGAKAALLVNAVVNVLALYAALRWLAARTLAGRPHLGQAVALAATALYLVSAATEGRALVNVGGFAPGAMLTTYYFGSILAGLICLALAAEATNGFRADAQPSGRRPVFALLGVLLVSALTTLSNPLFLVQFVGGFVLSVIAAWILRRIRLRRAALLAVSVLAGAAIGYAARGFFASMIAVDAASYLHLDRAGGAVSALISQNLDVLSTRGGKVELAIIAALIVGAVLALIASVHAQLRPGRTPPLTDAGAMLCLFVVFSAVVLLGVQVLTGSDVSRYLLPLAVYPVLVIPAAASSPALRALLGRLPRPSFGPVRRSVGVILGVVVVAAGLIVGLPPVVAAAHSDETAADSTCVTNWLAGRTLSGVGSFWTTRGLTLYGSSSIDVQQVNFDFSAQLWMNNLASYQGKTYSYVLADHDPDWAALALAHLGEPASVTACGSFDIYDYEATVGQDVLGTIVGTSVERAEENRGF